WCQFWCHYAPGRWRGSAAERYRAGGQARDVGTGASSPGSSAHQLLHRPQVDPFMIDRKRGSVRDPALSSPLGYSHDRGNCPSALAGVDWSSLVFGAAPPVRVTPPIKPGLAGRSVRHRASLPLLFRYPRGGVVSRYPRGLFRLTATLHYARHAVALT